MMLALLIFLFLTPDASAVDALPYSTRSAPYSGFSTIIRGDIRTVGMAGATVGLADTFIASTDNPAGLAMTMNHGDFNVTSNWIHDGRIQTYEDAINTSNIGVALNSYPWGFSLGWLSPYREGQGYLLQGMPNDPINLNIRTRELRAGIARSFLNNQVSAGFALSFGQGEIEHELVNDTSRSTAYHSYAVGATLGVQTQFGNRGLFGVSYSFPMRYVGNVAKTVDGITDYFQDIEVPGRLGMGLGWIPNRFFRMDLTLYVIGTTPEAALLKDQTISVGKTITLQPRLGAAYQFIDLRELSATFFAGTYYEVLRSVNGRNRLHGTAGIETKPWIFTIGWGIDAGSAYKNYLVTAGIDLFKLMEKADLIPRIGRPAYAGVFPQPNRLADEGLPRTLVRNWRPDGPEIDPIQAGLQIPKKLQEKVLNVIEPQKSAKKQPARKQVLRKRPSAAASQAKKRPDARKKKRKPLPSAEE